MSKTVPTEELLKRANLDREKRAIRDQKRAKKRKREEKRAEIQRIRYNILTLKLDLARYLYFEEWKAHFRIDGPYIANAGGMDTAKTFYGWLCFCKKMKYIVTEASARVVYADMKQNLVRLRHKLRSAK